MTPLQKLLWSAACLSALSVASLQAQDISHRKADLTVKVQSPSGAPLEGADVEIEMLNHAFRFGCATEYHLIDPSSANYSATTVANLQKYFNSTTYGNIMKWTYYEARTEEQNLAIAARPKSLNAFDSPDPLRLRGHVTIWGADYQIPNRVKNSSDGTYVHEQILSHVGNYHTTFKDSGIDSFDLYNEHFHVPQLLVDKIVPSKEMLAQAAEVATWFNKAKEADPRAVLYINEYNILNFWQENDSDVKAYKAFVDAIRDAGGQIDGIGLQAHMDRMITKTQMKRRFDLLAAPMAATANHPNGLPGLRLEITEYDINTQQWTTATPEQQATLTNNLLEAAFEHPAVDGITIWGMNDRNHWRSNALIFDDADTNNWLIKPSGQAYIDHVQGAWWQDHSGSSAANGDYSANTIKGTHKVTVTFNGESKEAIAHLASDDTLTFEFAATAADAATYANWTGFIDWQAADSTRTGDPDLDGRDNLEEFMAGTNPLSADYATEPRIVSQDGISFALAYTVRAVSSGLTIEIKRSPNLVDWTDVPASEEPLVPTIANGVASYLVPLPATTENHFYRIAVKEALTNQ